MSSFYYLKILLLLLSFNYVDIVHGGTIAKYADTISKKILMARSLPFEDCGSKYLILYLKISSCSSIPCVMHRGTTVEVNVIFDDDGDDISLPATYCFCMLLDKWLVGVMIICFCCFCRCCRAIKRF